MQTPLSAPEDTAATPADEDEDVDQYGNNKKRQPLELSPSVCQLHIRSLRDGYQDLTKKVIAVREDGGQYFHQEFAENVQTLAASPESRVRLALAMP